MADALATMRGRPRPGLDEVLDAADTVMGGLPIVRRQLVIGRAIGAVPDGAPQVPLARDLAKRQRTARLKVRGGSGAAIAIGASPLATGGCVVESGHSKTHRGICHA
jgi:hypothetical protein